LVISFNEGHISEDPRQQQEEKGEKNRPCREGEKSETLVIHAKDANEKYNCELNNQGGRGVEFEGDGRGEIFLPVNKR